MFTPNQGNSANYFRSNGIPVSTGEGKVLVKVYNNTGAAINYGVPKSLVLKYDTTEGIICIPLTFGTTDTVGIHYVGVCAEDASLADATYGWFQVEGAFGSGTSDKGAATSGSVAANDYLEIINSGTTFIDSGVDGGALITIYSVAIAIENVATNQWKIFLLGKPVGIAAS